MLTVGIKCRRGCRLAAVQAVIWLVAQSPALIEAQTEQKTETKAAAANVSEYRRATLGATGEATRGRRLFEDTARTRCAACHATGGRGVMLGPDLSSLGGGRTGAAEILDAILDPSAKIHPDYASTLVARKSGRVVQGLLRPLNNDEVEIVVSADETVRVARSEIEQQSPSRVSIMPTGLHEKLLPSEMADLLAYLLTLEPPVSRSPREAVDPWDIPRAVVPVTFQSIVDRDAPFHRPVWFGALPGHPDMSAVVEMQKVQIWLLKRGGSARTLFADVFSETISGELTGLTGLAFHPDFEPQPSLLPQAAHAARGWTSRGAGDRTQGRARRFARLGRAVEADTEDPGVQRNS